MYILYRSAGLILETCATPYEAQEARKKYDRKPKVRLDRNYKPSPDKSIEKWLAFKESVLSTPLYIAPLSVTAFRKRNPRKDIP